MKNIFTVKVDDYETSFIDWNLYDQFLYTLQLLFLHLSSVFLL